MKTDIKKIAFGAIIASMYTALTLLFAPISYGAIQFRISEALAVLPYFAPVAVDGLFIGCLISNIFGGNGIHDILFGSLATLAAAIATYRIRSKLLAPLPPVVINAVVIGAMLSLLYELDLFMSMLTVGIGQFVVLYALGLPLIFLLDKRKTKIFGEMLSKYRR